MRVLTRGTPPPTEEWIADCGVCGSELAVDVRDGSIGYPAQANAVLSLQYDCPVCHSRQWTPLPINESEDDVDENQTWPIRGA